MKKKAGVLVRKRVSLNLHPQVYDRVEEVVKRLNSQGTEGVYTLQRFIEESILRRLSEDWKTL